MYKKHVSSCLRSMRTHTPNHVETNIGTKLVECTVYPHAVLHVEVTRQKHVSSCNFSSWLPPYGWSMCPHAFFACGRRIPVGMMPGAPDILFFAVSLWVGTRSFTGPDSSCARLIKFMMTSSSFAINVCCTGCPGLSPSADVTLRKSLCCVCKIVDSSAITGGFLLLASNENCEVPSALLGPGLIRSLAPFANLVPCIFLPRFRTDFVTRVLSHLSSHVVACVLSPCRVCRNNVGPWRVPRVFFAIMVTVLTSMGLYAHLRPLFRSWLLKFACVCAGEFLSAKLFWFVLKARFGKFKTTCAHRKIIIQPASFELRRLRNFSVLFPLVACAAGIAISKKI